MDLSENCVNGVNDGLIDVRVKELADGKRGSRTGKISVTVYENLTNNEQQILVENFPEFDLVFSCSVLHPHAFAAAARKLEYRILINRLHIAGATTKPDGYDDLLCDIGGEYSFHLTQNHFSVHSCNPILDMRDAQRKVTRRENLLRSLLDNSINSLDVNKANRIKNFLSSDVDCDLTCNNKAQDCPRTARYGICLHSSYDISLLDFADIMVKKNMYEIYGSFIYSDLVMLQNNGIINGINCYFSIDHTADTIEFSFVNDNSMVYIHNLKNYLALITLNGFVSRDNKNSFVIELLENRAGIQFFKITRVEFIMERASMVKYLWLPSLKDKTRVHFYEIDHVKIASGDFKHAFKPVYFFVDTSVIDKVVSHAYASTESKFRPVEIFNFLLAYNGRIFFGSDVCVRFKQLPAYQSMLVANAIYVYVYIKKYDLGKVNQMLLGAVRHDRDLAESSFWRKFFHSKFSPSKVYNSEHIDIKFFRAMVQPFHSFLYWFKKSPYDAAKFLEQTCRFIRCSTELATHEYHVSLKDRVFTHSFKFDSVIQDLVPFDMKKKICDVLSDNVYPDANVVSLNDIVPLKIREDVKYNDNIPNGFLKDLCKFNNSTITLNGFSPLSLFTCFSNISDDTPMDYQADEVVLVLTKNDLGFVRNMASKVKTLYVLGLEPRFWGLISETNVVVLCHDVLKFCVVSAIVNLCPDYIFMLDKVDDNINSICIAINNIRSVKQKFIVNISLGFDNLVFNYLMSCISYIPKDFECGKNFLISVSKKGDLSKGFKIFSYHNCIKSKFSRLSSYSSDTSKPSTLSTPPFSFTYKSHDSETSSIVPPASFKYESETSSVADSFVSAVSLSIDDIVTSVVEDLVGRVEISIDESNESFVTCEENSDFVLNSLSDNILVKNLDSKTITLINNFVSGLNVNDATVRPGKMGRRLEWLFAPTDYSYSGKTTKALNKFIPFELSGLVDLGFYNTLLVVFYPDGTSGLPLHKDNEPEMAHDRVLTFSTDAFVLNLKLAGIDYKLNLSSNQSYEIIDQNGLLHGVDVSGPRYALTFRKFYVNKVPVPPVFGEILPLECTCDVSSLNFSMKSVNNFDFIDVSKIDISVSECVLLEFLSFVDITKLNFSNVVDLCASSGAWTKVLKHLQFNVVSIYGVGDCFKAKPDSEIVSSLYELDSLPECGMVFADTVLDDVSEGLSLIDRELRLALPTLLRGGFLFIKLYISTDVLNLLSQLPNFKVLRFFRFCSSDLLSSVFYMFCGGGIVSGSFDIENIFHSLYHNQFCNRFLAHHGFHILKPYVHYSSFNNCSVDLGGGGNCLFHALSGGKTITANELRAYILNNCPKTINHTAFSYEDVKEECTSPGVMAGVSTILAFCNLFNASVRIVDTLSHNLIADFRTDGRPLYDFTLCFYGSHYTRLASHTVVNRIYKPIPMASFSVDQLLSGFVKVLLPKFNIANFVNACADVCFEKDCECMNGIISKCKVGSLILFHRDSFDFVKFGKLKGVDYNLNLFCVPGISNSGFFLCLITEFVSEIDYTLSYEHMLVHSTTCDYCNTRTEFYSSPFYNHVFRSYFPCANNKFCEVVDSLTSTEINFELVPFSDSFSNIVVTEDKVFLPVSFVSRVDLDVSDKELKRIHLMLKNFFSTRKFYHCIGMYACVTDVSKIVDCFSSFCCKILVQNVISESPVDDCVNFSPSYVVNVDDKSYIYNALIESKEYYKSNVTSIVNNIKPLFSQYMQQCSSPNFCGGTNSFNNKPDFAIIDMSKGIYVVKPKDVGGPYQYAFDGKILVDISSAHRIDYKDTERKYYGDISWLKPGVFSGLMAVSRETRIINSDKIFKNLNSIDLEKPFDLPKIELIEGVPGCGKTHYVMNNHKFSFNDHKHIVLTSSREAVGDIRKRVINVFKCSPRDKILRTRYRTIDSFMMHYRRFSNVVEVLWVDEALMRHFGDLMWCALLSNCQTLRIIGDRAQIPFINRLPGVILRFSLLNLSEKTMTTNFLNTTFRCPIDVAAFLNRFKVYPSNVVSRSSVRKSLNSRTISSAAEVLNSFKGFYILTFTQDEKANILKAVNHTRVSTINEFQGNQAANVILIRTQTKNLEVFNSMSHILVAVSRHTNQFLYATVVKDKLFDMLSDPVVQSELSTATCTLGGGIILGKSQTNQFPIYTVTPRAATMIDMLRQDSRIRNFVMSNLGFGVAPLRVNLDEVPVEYVDNPFAPSFYVSDCVNTMQFFYDLIFPGHSATNFDYDNELFCQDDLFFSATENIRLSTYEKFYSPKFDGLSPALRTSCPSPVTNDLKHILKAFYDRNGCVPELSGQTDDHAMATMLFDNFVKTYVADKELFSTFIVNPVCVNVDSIEDWLFTQGSGVKDRAFPEDLVPIFFKELNKYSMILKKLPKPKLEQGADFKFPSPQTIAHSDKDINAFFCPIIREIKRRIISVLPSNVLIFSDISITDFEKLLTVRLPVSRLKFLKFMLEADMSKYDKSQNRVALLFEIKLLRAFGFPEELISTWVYMHVYSKLVCHFANFSANIFFQRKSGDSMTYLGNTVFLMAVMASVGIPNFSTKVINGEIFIMFSGDDILAFLNELIDIKFTTHEFAIRFNLESKILNFGTAYFCSKFLFPTPWGNWIMVPDVVKMLTKLGRRDLVNYRHVEEYRISCNDVGLHLSNSVLYPFIDDCIKDRYKLKDYNSFGSLYSAMSKCFSSSLEFKKLYYIRDGFNIDSDRQFTRLNEF